MHASIAHRDPKLGRRDGKRASESAVAIRPKKFGLARVDETLSAVTHENFFIAKPCDSEFVRSVILTAVAESLTTCDRASIIMFANSKKHCNYRRFLQY